MLVESPSSGLSTSAGPVKIFRFYTPTLSSPSESKDRFYEEPYNAIKVIQSTEHLYLLDDFNAQVGADHNSWLQCMRHFGVRKITKNGQRLLEFCYYHDLCITNTFFSVKPAHEGTLDHSTGASWISL